MTDGITERLASVTSLGGYRLAVTWRDGERTIIDFSDDVQRGGIWTDLRDPAKFMQARIAERGTILEWAEPAGPDGAPRVDIDADGLYELGLQQHAQPLSEKLLNAVFSRPKAV